MRADGCGRADLLRGFIIPLALARRRLRSDFEY